MAIIKNISRLSELRLFSRVVEGMKTIVAFNKKNYSIEVKDIEGSKIADITEAVASGENRRNTIAVKLEDGSRFPFYVYDGHQGDKGAQGIDGEAGEKGKSGEVSAIRSENSLTIVNDNETKSTDKAWAAYRGKEVYTQVRAMNETFVTEEEYDMLWNNVVWMNAEFTTSHDDESVTIFNSDTNEHTLFHKYWTYEDAGLETFYVAIYDKDGNIIRYDSVSADRWIDVYQGAKSGYFASTASQQLDGSKLYYYDDKDKEYKEIELLYAESEDGPIYVGGKVLDYYVKGIETYVHANYNVGMKKWEYDLIASELPIIVYKTEDGQTFTEVPLDEISTATTAKYYSAPNFDSPIDDIKKYITRPNTRYYVLDNSTNLTHKHGDNTAVAHYKEVKALSDVDTKNFQEYIIASYDLINNEYTYTHYYPIVVKKETVYTSKTAKVNNGTITLYSYMDNREYYTAEIETVLDAEGNVTSFNQVYSKVTIPFWMYAQFQTTEEDENILIINTNKELGDGLEEDYNKVDDTTTEEGEEEVEKIPITNVIFGDVPVIYTKDSNNKYVEVDFETDKISEDIKYFTKDIDLTYVEISGNDALDLPSGTVIYKETNGIYTATSETIVSTDTYYLGKETYTEIADIDAFLHNESIVLFNGEPQQVYVNIFPSTATDKRMEMSYEPDKVTLYEDGRIAAVANNCETDIIITTSDGSNIDAVLHIVLTMPMKSIKLESAKKRINIGETSSVEASIFPANTSNTKVDFAASKEGFVTITAENNIATVKGVAAGKINIIGTANDGYGAKSTIDFEVIQPATAIEWDQENIIATEHEEVYWGEDADAENADHLIDPNDPSKGYVDGYTEVSPSDIKTPAWTEYSMNVLMGIEYELMPVVKPTDTTYPNIVWETSDNKNIKVSTATRTVIDVPAVTHPATQQDVDDNKADNIGDTVIDVPAVTHSETYYVLKATKAGEYTVTAKITIGNEANPVTKSINVKVRQAVEEMKVSPNALEFNVATRKKLTLEILPAPVSGVTDEVNRDFEWVSEDDAIATVDKNGVVYGVSSGKTKIKACALDGSGVTGVCNVTITVPAKDITIMGSDADTINGIVYVGVGKSTKLESVITYNKPSLADTDISKNVIWRSSDERIATVDANGNVTGVDIVDGKNDVTIIASAADGSGVFGSIRVYVIKLITSISFEESEINMNVGDSYVLVPDFEPVDASNEVVIWKTSDESYATVNNGGIVTALKAGEVTITAETTDGSELNATCTVKITE